MFILVIVVVNVIKYMYIHVCHKFIRYHEFQCINAQVYIKRGSIISRLHYDVITIMKILPRSFHDASTLMPILLRSYNAFTPIHFSHAPATLVLNMFKISVAGSWSFTFFAIIPRSYHAHEDPPPMGHDHTTIGHDSVPN